MAGASEGIQHWDDNSLSDPDVNVGCGRGSEKRAYEVKYGCVPNLFLPLCSDRACNGLNMFY